MGVRFKCKESQAQFRRRDYLKRHMKTVHPAPSTSIGSAPSDNISDIVSQPPLITKFDPDDFNLDWLEDNPLQTQQILGP